jgi:hypothetical protein
LGGLDLPILQWRVFIQCQSSILRGPEIGPNIFLAKEGVVALTLAMTMQKIIVIAILLGAAFFAMQVYGLSAGDVIEMAKSQLHQAGSDSRALMSGEYSERMTREMREEAKKLSTSQSFSGDGYDAQLNRELAAERQRLMEQRADALNERGKLLIRGDVETLKRQATENVRQAGGAP